MNITVLSPKGVYCRPDTSLEREDKDFYIPDNVSDYAYTPVVFARISKAGKCIGRKFAGRYYDAIGFGALLYACKSSEADVATASCHDHTSILPQPLYNPITLENPSNAFALSIDGNEIFSVKVGEQDFKDIIEEALYKVSPIVSQRTGDFVAVELSEMKNLIEDVKEGEEHTLKGGFCDNALFEIKMIK